MPPGELLAAARRHEDPAGWAVLEAARVGEHRLLGLFRAKRSLKLVERDGEWTDVATIDPRGPDGSTLSARLVDLNGDGLLDLAGVEIWEPHREKKGEEFVRPAWKRRGSYPFALLRSMAPREAAARGGMELDLAMAGTRALDAAVQGARRLFGEKKEVTPAQACDLVVRGMSRGYRGLAVPDAKILFFSEPQEPGWVDRVVPAHRVRQHDLERLTCCEIPGDDCEDDVTTCRGSVCGAFDYALGCFYQFIWEGDRLRLVKAAIYVGP